MESDALCHRIKDIIENDNAMTYIVEIPIIQNSSDAGKKVENTVKFMSGLPWKYINFVKEIF